MTVVRSLNEFGALRCVDIIEGDDGQFRYQEFRRDPEDPSGWYAVGAAPAGRYSTAVAALDAAREAVDWLEDAIPKTS